MRIAFVLLHGHTASQGIMPAVRHEKTSLDITMRVVLKILGPFWVIDYFTAPNISEYQNKTLILGATHEGSEFKVIVGGTLDAAASS